MLLPLPFDFYIIICMQIYRLNFFLRRRRKKKGKLRSSLDAPQREPKVARGEVLREEVAVVSVHEVAVIRVILSERPIVAEQTLIDRIATVGVATK
jgi:hypothetical protein